ncbi:hypothetical protein ACHQM5_026556 [Ranunculus cassubicifolius]
MSHRVKEYNIPNLQHLLTDIFRIQARTSQWINERNSKYLSSGRGLLDLKKKTTKYLGQRMGFICRDLKDRAVCKY